MKYFLLQTSCEHKSPSHHLSCRSTSLLPNPPVYRSICICADTAAQPSRGQTTQTCLRLLHPWFIGATRGFCEVWYASESQRSRRPVGNSWLCGFVLPTLTSMLAEGSVYMLLWLCMSAVWTPIEMKPQEINACDQCGIVMVHWDTTTPLRCPRTLEKASSFSAFGNW